jgi:hypothetical protein
MLYKKIGYKLREVKKREEWGNLSDQFFESIVPINPED